MSGYATVPRGGKMSQRPRHDLEDLRTPQAQGILDIQTCFRTGQPVFYVGPAAFNPLGIDASCASATTGMRSPAGRSSSALVCADPAAICM
jgi:hypothetical protein